MLCVPSVALFATFQLKPRQKEMAHTAPLSAELTAMVQSYNELLPGVAWNDSVVNALLAQAAANEASCTICVNLQLGEHGDAEVALEIHSHLCKCHTAPAYAMASVWWSLPDTTVWESRRPATKDGLLELLLDVRRIVQCMQRGPCAACLKKRVPEHNLRLTPTSDCLSCVLCAFFSA